LGKWVNLFKVVIPAEAGIQDFPMIFLDSRFHGNDLTTRMEVKDEWILPTGISVE
jgi:hypothetical protein